MSDVNVVLGQSSVNVSVGAAVGASGADGREIEIQNNGTHIQWRYIGDVIWTNLIALSALKGDQGEVGVNPRGAWDSLTSYVVDDLVTHNGSAYVCTVANQGNNPVDINFWDLFVSAGVDGREIELQKSLTHIQWRYVGDVSWINLVALSDITVPLVWGNITGTLSSQADLQNALNAKQDDLGFVYASPMTWATLLVDYPAASHSGKMAKVSDIGIGPYSMWVSDGVKWRPANGSLTIANTPIPVGKAPTFTGTTNGAITFAVSVVTVGEAYLYYPENSITASHPAGFYYTRIDNGSSSSANFGTVYNNTYTPADGVLPTKPTVLMPFSGAVPGGTGVTSVLTALIKTLPFSLIDTLPSVQTIVTAMGGSNAAYSAINVLVNDVLAGTENMTNQACVSGLHVIKCKRRHYTAPLNFVPKLTSSGAYNVPDSSTGGITFKWTLLSGTAAAYLYFDHLSVDLLL